MNLKQWTEKAPWREILVWGALSVLIYNFLGFLFLVPLQMLFEKGKNRSYVIICSVMTLYIIIVLFVQGQGITVIIHLLALFQLGGLFFVNSKFLQIKRKLYRFLLATIIFSLLCIPIVILFEQSKVLQQGFSKQVALLKEFAQQASSRNLEGDNWQEIFGTESVESWLQLLLENLLSRISLYFLVSISFCWYLGKRFSRKIRRKKGWHLSSFKLPENFIWPLLLFWAVYLPGELLFPEGIKELGRLWYIVSNSALVFLFLYIIQGMAIINFIIEQKLRKGRGIMLVLLISGGMLMITLLFNSALFVLLALLGVSELWINYRKPEKEKNNDEDYS